MKGVLYQSFLANDTGIGDKLSPLSLVKGG